jgi:hypothetical protein
MLYTIQNNELQVGKQNSGLEGLFRFETLFTAFDAVGNSCGMGRPVKSNTLQIRMDSSFRQGCVLYELFQLCQSTLAFSRSPRVGV